jgi:hypothetical protein
MKTTSDEICWALSEKHQKDFFLTEVKTGPTWNAKPGELSKIDALAMKKSWAKPCLTAYEVKVSRQDFLNDHKYHAYFDYCHVFYFVCPNGIIKSDELADEIGLLWYNEGKITTKKKALFRPITIPASMLYYIVLSRIESDRHPFFTSEKAYQEAFLRNQKDAELLRFKVESKAVEDIVALKKKIEELERKIEHGKKSADQMNEVKKILLKHGIMLLDPVHSLDEYMTTNDNRQIKNSVEQILDRIKSLEKKVNSEPPHT